MGDNRGVQKSLLSLLLIVLALTTFSMSSFTQGNWNSPQAPFRIFGNTYYVGTAGLSVILITSDAGHILIDGAVPAAPPLIEANVRTLGFEPRDIRLILNSHEHFDHAGGLAALQRSSGARVAASPSAARALGQGHPTPEDPQYQSGLKAAYPALKNVETIADGTALRVGSLAITPHFTPGHTPGATSWSWRSCEGSGCVDIVYADSLSPVSDDGFRFTGDGKRRSMVDTFRRSIMRVQEMPCDIILAPHPEAFSLSTKLARLKEHPELNPFIEDNACRTFAAAAMKRLEQRIVDEKK